MNELVYKNETTLRADMSEDEREAVRGRIREVLSGEVAAVALDR